MVARLRAAGCVFAEEEAAVLTGAAADAAHLETLVARRVAGEPLELVVGQVEFAGLRLRVGPGVFVPRQRTTAMVDEAVALLTDVVRPRVVDVCCGVGAVGCAVVRRLAHADLAMGDVDPAAVRLAASNLEALGAPTGWRQRLVRVGDLFAAAPDEWRGTVDVCTANAPYVPTHAVALMPRDSRDHEPLTAVDGGEDGLAVHRRLAAEAPGWLRPGGHLVVEVGESQVETVSRVLSEHALSARAVWPDDEGPVVVVATMTFDPAPPRLRA
ncbi:putative protein N(5)-glutamine methyltransferase [Nocardioides jishulii]|uniref:peptide chain release factor N(5)-glutamine methyltransferase n=1 Tax=Nocardioides jishulii TaxID=2575440 RepID=A0A4U2YHF1_9ACTN|nr:putative protein N(5)-glutamine methyltransferase [Nocardioides jishulii]TKI60466.1 putative protein N(5)-glutamine methyltransferase [Nocardioides jishulii]